MTLDESEKSETGVYFPFVNGKLPPEPPFGNIEYKLRLNPASETRLKHLSTQLKWRLREGLGEAIYEIGIGDDGRLVGLSDEEMTISLSTMRQMANSIGAEILLIRDFTHDGRKVAEVFLRQTPENPDEFVDFRIAVLGNFDSGKSTLLGVLSSGELDNGRGKARLNIFRHPHEIQTGRTSSVSREMIGFTTTGQVVNYGMLDSPEDIFHQSFKLITFTDLAGHHKYLRTTISGLTSSKPDFVMLVISGLTGCSQTTAEYLALAYALRLPVFVVVTKVDCCEQTRIDQVVFDLKVLVEKASIQQSVMSISAENDCISAAFRMACEPVIPVFSLSSVTGLNLNLLTKFLSFLRPCTANAPTREVSVLASAEFQIDRGFIIDGVGTVITGILLRGKLSAGSWFLLGPDCKGLYTKVYVKSIQRNHAPCRTINIGQSAAVAVTLEDEGFRIRRGMILVDLSNPLVSCSRFESVLEVLSSRGLAFTKGIQGTVHCGYICQTAEIVSVRDDCDPKSKIVALHFMQQPECLHPGDQFVFRNGHLKAIGTVSRVEALDN